MRVRATRFLRTATVFVLMLVLTSLLLLSPVSIPNSTTTTQTNESHFRIGSLLGERQDGIPDHFQSASHGNAELGLSLEELKVRVKRNNEEQVVTNVEKFGPVDNETIVIAVQVHNREQNLQYLLQSLRQATGIEKALLVFSHDVWLEEVNKLIATVDFAMVTQIFYPHSIQLNPDHFPGQSPEDCHRDEPKAKALARNCSNAAWPDVYGHYREAEFTQTKHHWWWKANYIFDKLEVVKDSSGLVLFLEEDHYVAPDFLHVLRLADQKRRDEVANDCDIITLGTYLTNPNYARHGRQTMGSHPMRPLARSLLWTNYLGVFLQKWHKAEILDWFTTKHNMGMAFDESLWQRLRGCRQLFCSVDDYNWDWSLLHVSLACLKPQRLRVMLVSAPRIFHVGECGVHHKKAKCDVSSVVSKVEALLKAAGPHLFPSGLEIKTSPTSKKSKPPRRNGGWGDERDHRLCLSFTNDLGV